MCRLKEEEVNIIRKIFKMNILNHKELRKRECEKAMDEHQELRRLSWKKIKNTVHNYITLEKKKIKKMQTRSGKSSI